MCICSSYEYFFNKSAVDSKSVFVWVNIICKLCFCISLHAGCFCFLVSLFAGTVTLTLSLALTLLVFGRVNSLAPQVNVDEDRTTDGNTSQSRG